MKISKKISIFFSFKTRISPPLARKCQPLLCFPYVWHIQIPRRVEGRTDLHPPTGWMKNDLVPMMGKKKNDLVPMTGRKKTDWHPQGRGGSKENSKFWKQKRLKNTYLVNFFKYRMKIDWSAKMLKKYLIELWQLRLVNSIEQK